MPPIAASAGPVFSSCGIEVEQQGLPLGADQDVGGLDVTVEHAALVGVLQTLGESCGDPDGRAGVIERGERGQWGLARRRRHRPLLSAGPVGWRRLHRLQGLDEFAAVPWDWADGE